ncbi:flagellar biosynthesis anti-sigma factor FlgM [Thioflavicoccus mobilis 8321]|uniref:Negative regulator of flagellin synthesis n=2 Tax=Thioflavicoccus mobilis TaxID=80679 RepID=L0GUW5_9GAMM|nr:flagellar biosynthesis anti-sigma factor FlgM [Thioflavicoccus mobilis 8321]
MPTEIGQPKGVQGPVAPSRERVSRGPGQASSATPGRGAVPEAISDEVVLSSSALKLRQSERSLSQGSEVDEARVASIRDALSKGTYQIDVGRVAKGILAQERLFFGGGDQ